MAMLDACWADSAVVGGIAGRSVRVREGEMRITGRGGARLSASAYIRTAQRRGPLTLCVLNFLRHRLRDGE
jgi:hypothetical protein